MPKILTNVEMLKRVTVWVDAPQWEKLSVIVPNRSEFIREQIDIVVAANRSKWAKKRGKVEKNASQGSV